MRKKILNCLLLSKLNSIKVYRPFGLRQASDIAKSDPLVDSIGRRHTYLRISLTERCNLRCQYCMPVGGAPLSPRPELLTAAETLRATRALVRLGVSKVRLTGGEPTLRQDLPEIIESISSLSGVRSVSLTTNGLTLTRRLPSYQRAGLSALNVSLDSLVPDKYERMARRPGLAKVLAGIDLALQLGYRPLKINTVLMRGFNDDEICDFVAYTKDREIEVRFIEFMPFSGNSWDASRMVPHEELLDIIRTRYPDLQRDPPRLNDTAQVFRVPSHLGSVGLISSMTRPFCGSCNRLRLTATGGLKVCLFGDVSLSIRELIRASASDAELAAAVKQALKDKKPQHAVTPPARRRNVRARERSHRAHGAHRRVGSTRAASAQLEHVVCWTHPSPNLPATRSSLHAVDLPTLRIPLQVCHSEIFQQQQLPVLRAMSPSHFKFSRVSAKSPTGLNDRALWMTSGTSTFIASRAYSSDSLSHVDSTGRARMVDVGSKAVTTRRASAECTLLVQEQTLRLLQNNELAKGDARCVAELAGVMAAKKTSELIPLCHSVPLDRVTVHIELPTSSTTKDTMSRVVITCEVACSGRTGVEMEALTGASVAALALYDMCKAVDKRMRVTDLRVTQKSGGRSGQVYQ